MQQRQPTRLNRNKILNRYTFTIPFKMINYLKSTITTIYTPVQLILRILFKSHWVIIFLNEVLDGALTTLSGKEFQGVTTLEPQKYFLASVLQCNFVSFRLCLLVVVMLMEY